MKFQTPLVPARLIRRYKRFLADAALEGDGREVTAHCPNPGAMLGLNEPGSRIWLEAVDAPNRKLPFAWRLAELDGGHMAGIDTGIPNRIVEEALRERRLPGFEAYTRYKPEVFFSEHSRLDFRLGEPGLPDVYLEVKNVHLRREGDWAEFPDCVTKRGAKHLRELSDVVASGARAVMFYVIQRTDCSAFKLADDLDPGYAHAFSEAVSAGVEAVAVPARITTAGIWLETWTIPIGYP